MDRFPYRIWKIGFNTPEECSTLIILSHALATWIHTDDILFEMEYWDMESRQVQELVYEVRSQADDDRSVREAPFLLFEQSVPSEGRSLARLIEYFMALDWNFLLYHGKQEVFLWLLDGSIYVMAKHEKKVRDLSELLTEIAVPYRNDWNT
jgi:hypothetical protein